MPELTLPIKDKIAVVFDFDETLAPPTHLNMLKKTGIDGEERENFVKKLLDQGWEKILARAYSWIKYSQDANPKITRQMFQSVGEELELYDGVDTLFDRLRGFCPDSIDLEFYLLTAGFVEVPQATSIADEFKEIWGGAYAFNEQDELVFIKNMITHEEKREYIQQLAKGTGTAGPNVPADSHQHVDEEDMYVPFTQIVYVGDGSSDRPAFSLLHEMGGFAIGLAKDNSAAWKENDKLKKSQKVDNLLKVDYTEGSELMQCLQLAIECIAKRILLRKVGKA
jgi:phosphoserine phosphatase